MTSRCACQRGLRWRALDVIRYDLHFTAKFLIICKLAAAPVHFFLLVATLYKSGQRNEPGRLVHPPEPTVGRSEEHTSELQSRFDLVCRLLLEKKNNIN